MPVCGFVLINSCTYGGQKRVSDPLEMEPRATVTRVPWVLSLLNLSLLQEQHALLTTESSLQPHTLHLRNVLFMIK